MIRLPKIIKALLLILIVYPLQSQTITVRKHTYTVEYSEKLEQPVSLTYISSNREKNVSRGSMDFYKEEGYKTSDAADYYKNPYDKGHLAPAAAFNCTRDMVKATFSYLNCALQHEGLNRGPWKELEAAERVLAMFYEVDVTIEVIFDSNPERVPGGAAIPKAFRKIITINHNEVYEYYFPNEDVAGQDWWTFGTEGNPVK